MCGNNDSKGSNVCIFLLEIGCILLFVCLLGMCIFQFYKMGNPASRNVTIDSTPPKIHITFQVTDSITDTTMIAKMDSLRKEIKAWNRFSEKKLMHGLDDLRQETNNVIDKQNGWLSFWLGIFALVGALLPFLFQLKIQKNQDQLMKSKMKEVDQTVNGIKTDLKNRKEEINTKVQELKEERKNNQKVIDLIKNDHEKALLYTEITQLSNTLITCKENKWGKDHLDRNVLWNDLFTNLCHKTSRFVVLVAPDKEVNFENVFLVKTILLQLHAVYCAFIPTCAQTYQSRKLLELTKEISEVLENVSHNCYNGAGLYQALEHLLIQMGSFSLK